MHAIQQTRSAFLTASGQQTWRAVCRPFVVVLLDEDDGQDLIEYVLLLGFVALVAVSALASTQTSMNRLWNNLSDAICSAVTAMG